MFIILYEKQAAPKIGRREFGVVETVFHFAETAQEVAQREAMQRNCRTWTIELPEIPLIETATVSELAAFRK